MTAENTNFEENLKIITENQCGYFTAKQAVAAGYNDSHHLYYVKKGHWEKAGRGIYRLPGYENDTLSECVRMSLWSRNQQDQPQGVISFDTALYLHGLSENRPDKTHLTVPASFRKKVPQDCVIHKASLSLSVIEGSGAVMITRPIQTLADMRPALEETGIWEKTVLQAAQKNILSKQEAVNLGIDGDELQKVSSRTNTADTSSEPLTPADTEPQTHESLKTPLEESENEEDNTYGQVAQGVWDMIFDRTARRNVYRAGFTLVELLVVIAIISILAAMLMPALGKAMDSARAIKCESNLKNLGLAGNLYADDFNDHWPIIYDGSNWGLGIMRNYTFISYFIGGSFAPTYSGSYGIPVYTQDQTMPPSYLCPSRPHTTMVDGLVESFKGYPFSWQGLRDADSSFSIFSQNDGCINISKIKRASHKLVTMDGTNWHIVAQNAEPGITTSPRVEYRHNGRANTLFLDGHVKALGASELYLTPRTGKDIWDTYDMK